MENAIRRIYDTLEKNNRRDCPPTTYVVQSTYAKNIAEYIVGTLLLPL